MKRDINSELSKEIPAQLQPTAGGDDSHNSPFGVLGVESGQFPQPSTEEKNSEESVEKNPEKSSENIESSSSEAVEKAAESKGEGGQSVESGDDAAGARVSEAGESSADSSEPAESSDDSGDSLIRKKIEIEKKVIDILKTVYDPEIPVNIYELGLVYNIRIDDQMRVQVEMTLTSPTCPVAGSLPGEVEEKLKAIEGVTDAAVILVWDPPWNPEMMSEAARLELGFFF